MALLISSHVFKIPSLVCRDSIAALTLSGPQSSILQVFHQFRDGTTTVADAVLHLQWHFRKADGKAVGHEYRVISKALLSISFSKDDAIHATTVLTVNGGELNITAAEGLEATQVEINGGAVYITATDDGINAGQKSKALSVGITINGGEISIDMGAGDTDAVDSNGYLTITGGTIDISGQSSFDADGTISWTGGTIYVNGSQISTITNQMMGGGMPGGGMQGGFNNGWGH